jgi:hypothetical protein
VSLAAGVVAGATACEVSLTDVVSLPLALLLELQLVAIKPIIAAATTRPKILVFIGFKLNLAYSCFIQCLTAKLFRLFVIISL